MPSALLHPEVHTQKDFLPLNGIDYLEFYVGNARQSAFYYRAAFGMTLVAWAGPETGLLDRSSYVLEQGSIRFVLTTPLRPDGGMAAHIHRHGDGVRDVALSVPDAKLAWRESTRRGARSVHECRTMQDDYGRVKVASIAAYGDTIHTFVERDSYFGPFLPGYDPVETDRVACPVGLSAIDHVAGNVGWNESRRWADYYTEILGFSLHPRSEAAARWESVSPIRSKVVHCASAKIVFPINEPAGAREKSSVEQYLESYHGAGVQRVALSTSNLLETVTLMRRQGVDFMPVPHAYYTRLRRDSPSLREPVDELERLGVLVDRDEGGYMLQAFTRPVEDRPTLFFELIERRGSTGTGEKSLKALAAAIEEETQSLRNR